jgi:hypothetical protein
VWFFLICGLGGSAGGMVVVEQACVGRWGIVGAVGGAQGGLEGAGVLRKLGLGVRRLRWSVHIVGVGWLDGLYG